MRAIWMGSMWLGVALGSASGCIPAPSTDPRVVARDAFAHEHYCPRGRASTEARIPVPAPPPEIAKDPERLAMWTRANTGAIPEVKVSGCGEEAVYACWTYTGERDGPERERRFRRRYRWMTVCLAKGDAS